jgi:hypothetical protein
MDATQKRRMWKVAASHFVLSLAVVLGALLCPEDFNHPSVVVVPEILAQSLVHCFYFLQPVFSLGVGAKLLSGNFYFALLLASIPIWSLCFGWLFVKLDNWLNHFPVFGRKVF